MYKFIEFHNYIKELCDLYQKTGNLKNLSIISRKYGVKALTKVQFFQFGLHEVKGEPSREKSDEIRKAMLDEHRKYNHSKKLESKLNIDNIDFPPTVKEILKLEADLTQPWEYAMKLNCDMDYENEFMVSVKSRESQVEELRERLYFDNGTDYNMFYIVQYMRFQLPIITTKDGVLQTRYIGCVKTSFDETYYLAGNKNTLKLLAWIAYYEGIKI